jgi:hypothetical protein
MSCRFSLALTVIGSVLIGSGPAAADDFIRDSGSNVINSGLAIVGIGFREPGSVIVFSDGVGDPFKVEFACLMKEEAVCCALTDHRPRVATRGR